MKCILALALALAVAASPAKSIDATEDSFQTAFCGGFARNASSVAAANDIGSTLSSVVNTTNSSSLSASDKETLSSISQLLVLAGQASAECGSGAVNNETRVSRRLSSSGLLSQVCKIPEKLCNSGTGSVKPVVGAALTAGEKLLKSSSSQQSLIAKVEGLACSSAFSISCGDKKVVANSDGSTTSTSTDSSLLGDKKTTTLTQSFGSNANKLGALLSKITGN